MRWELEEVESRYPYGFTIAASGDFDGRGVWTFEQDGASVNLAYDWRLRAEKPLLKNLSFLLKPLFAANHRWAMAQGEESLKLELPRRRATSGAARARCRRRRVRSLTRPLRSSPERRGRRGDGVLVAARAAPVKGKLIRTLPGHKGHKGHKRNVLTYKLTSVSLVFFEVSTRRELASRHSQPPAPYFSSKALSDASARSQPKPMTS